MHGLHVRYMSGIFKSQVQVWTVSASASQGDELHGSDRVHHAGSAVTCPVLLTRQGRYHDGLECSAHPCTGVALWQAACHELLVLGSGYAAQHLRQQVYSVSYRPRGWGGLPPAGNTQVSRVKPTAGA